MMYLLLSVAGHLTIFQTRTRGPFWSIKPAQNSCWPVVGTQVAATLICVFGFLVTPLWWGWVALVWVYALSWFLVTDRVKLIAYWALDRIAAKSAPNVRPGAAPEAKVTPKPDAGPQTPAAPLQAAG